MLFKRIIAKLRNYLLTGLVVIAPIAITFYIIKWFISSVDTWIWPFVPQYMHPEQYLPFTIPGSGLVLALILLTLIGAITANLFVYKIISTGEKIVAKMPVIRIIYGSVKQIFETVTQNSKQSFQGVGIIEYPRKGSYSIVFITAKIKYEIPNKINKNLVSVFLPTTPNPTSGFLLFVPKEDVIMLDMSLEEAAKMIVSAGLIEPKK